MESSVKLLLYDFWKTGRHLFFGEHAGIAHRRGSKATIDDPDQSFWGAD